MIVFLARGWSRYFIWLTGSKLIIEGEENLPTTHDYCVISNHQGYLDIPTLMSVMPWTLAFVAKKELKKLPIIWWWMSQLGVLFIDRSDRRQAVAIINKGAEHIRSGHPMVIFPEGTRSQGGPVATFKKGSLKMALRSNAKIVPVSIDGTYKVLEANNFKVQGGNQIRVKIHPLVDISTLSDDEKANLAERLQAAITTGVTLQ